MSSLFVLSLWPVGGCFEGIIEIVSQVCQLSAPCSQGQTCVETCPTGYEPGQRTLKCSSEGVYVVHQGSCILLAPISFSYAQTDLELLKDKAMTSIPANYAGAELSFSVKDADLGKALPAGINIDSKNGTLYGTPVNEQEKTTYTLLCRNIRADITTEISISVVTEKANYTLVIIIIVCVVLLVALFGTCFFFRMRGTGRARAGKHIKSAKGNKASTRV